MFQKYKNILKPSPYKKNRTNKKERIPQHKPVQYMYVGTYSQFRRGMMKF